MQARRWGQWLGARVRQRPARYVRIVLIFAILAFAAYYSTRSGAGWSPQPGDASGRSLRLRVRLRGDGRVRTAQSFFADPGKFAGKVVQRFQAQHGCRIAQTVVNTRYQMGNLEGIVAKLL